MARAAVPDQGLAIVAAQQHCYSLLVRAGVSSAVVSARVERKAYIVNRMRVWSGRGDGSARKPRWDRGVDVLQAVGFWGLGGWYLRVLARSRMG